MSALNHFLYNSAFINLVITGFILPAWTLRAIPWISGYVQTHDTLFGKDISAARALPAIAYDRKDQLTTTALLGVFVFCITNHFDAPWVSDPALSAQHANWMNAVAVIVYAGILILAGIGIGIRHATTPLAFISNKEVFLPTLGILSALIFTFLGSIFQTILSGLVIFLFTA